ncbi:hypothetical protein NDN08_001275 [Rhodosorus marinus]|uniref:SKP1-like protein n=1 Tax=Rhodosorus marinus TaxID=101924 RepID=A0AAV8UQB4_9RHOD|nr:hypothetical protein NDN08_001275 [Rhodosorus marinus]
MATTGRRIVLVSKEGDAFEVDYGVAIKSQIVADTLADLTEDAKVVPLNRVESAILALVVKYCQYHYDALRRDYPEEDIKKWDKDFVKIDKEVLLPLAEIAHQLLIQDLFDLACKAIAGLIRGKSTEEIQELFGIVNDFTEAEKAEIRKKYKWMSDVVQQVDD